MVKAGCAGRRVLLFYGDAAREISPCRREFSQILLTEGKRCAIIIKLMKQLGVAQLVARYLGVVEAVGSSPVTPTSRRVRKHAVYGLFSLPVNCACPLPVHYCPEDAFCPQLVFIKRIFLSLPSGSGGGVSFLEKSRTFAIASLARAFAS